MELEEGKYVCGCSITFKHEEKEITATTITQKYMVGIYCVTNFSNGTSPNQGGFDNAKIMDKKLRKMIKDNLKLGATINSVSYKEKEYYLQSD